MDTTGDDISLPELPLGPNSWLEPGPAAFDFRGDVRTSPTAAMLQAVTHASLLDDIDRSDTSTRALEEYVAALAGREASLWVVSGTMGNLVSLRTLLTQPPYAVVCDARCHAVTNEAGGAFAFAGAVPQTVLPANGRHLTLEDILPHVKLGQGEKVHMCPTRVIALENTLRGMVLPLAEARRISEFARANDIKLHLDGARLWEVVAAGEGSLREYCALFDTVTMCFSKGLGAPAGAVVLGSQETIRHARWIRQSIGGSIRQPGILAAAAHVAVRETFEKKRLARTHEVAKEIADLWESYGGKLQYPADTNMVWLDFSGRHFGLAEVVKKAQEKGIRIHRDRVVVHYQICDEAVQALKETFKELMQSEENV